MNENVDQRLRNLIAKLTLKYNYWGYLFSRVRRRSSNEIPSIMGVGPEPDGTVSLYYNPDLIKDTDDQTIILILTHEGFHLLNKHISRLLRLVADEINTNIKQTKSKIWNIAADCCVNAQANIPNILRIAGREYESCRAELYDLPKDKSSENSRFSKKPLVCKNICLISSLSSSPASFISHSSSLQSKNQRLSLILFTKIFNSGFISPFLSKSFDCLKSQSSIFESKTTSRLLSLTLNKSNNNCSNPILSLRKD